jgi:hypothetical protein
VCNLADPSDTYAVIWQPKKPPVRSVPVVPVAGRAGCYTYQVRSSEPYLSKVAEVFGVPLRQLLLDNTDRVTALDASPVGRRLVICNPDPEVVQLVLPGGTSPANAPPTGSTSTSGTGQPMRGTGPPQSTPGSSRPRPAPGGTSSSTPAKPTAAGGPGPVDGSTPQPAAPAPADTDATEQPPQQQQQQAAVLPLIPRRSAATSPDAAVVRTQQGCTCKFYAQDYPGVGRCNWYTEGEPSPWCYTDASNGPCGRQSLMSFFGGDVRWDYIAGTPPGRSCLRSG